MDNPAHSELLKNLSKLRNELELELADTASHVKRGLSWVDAVITTHGLNSHDAIGTLIHSILGKNKSLLSICSSDLFIHPNADDAVNLVLQYQGLSRVEVFEKVLNSLRSDLQLNPNRILCIPHYPDDVLSAIAIKELFDISLCTYIVYDKNVYANFIPRSLMQELLIKSSLRLIICPKLRDVYESQYGLKFWLLPPIVPNSLIDSNSRKKDEKFFLNETPSPPNRGILVETNWNQRWADLLQSILSKSGVSVDRYQAEFTDVQPHSLESSNYSSHTSSTQEILSSSADLALRLRQYAYVVVPASPLDQPDYQAIDKLSFPGGIPFILASSHTPIVVLGNHKTATAYWVERLGIGVVCNYDAVQFREVVEFICQPENQASMRQNAVNKAQAFAAEGVDDWLWRSLYLGEPCDRRFEDVLPRHTSELVNFIEPPVPADVYIDFVPIYQTIRRLKQQGFNPDFVLDVGASVGSWSYVVSKLLPDARFILIDPLISRYSHRTKQIFLGNHPEFELVEVAISNQPGKTSLQVSPDLYGSSLLHPADFRTYETVDVEVITLDQLAQQKSLTGRGLLKIDVQCAEHLVIEGAKQLLAQIDAVVLESSLVRYDERAKVYGEMIQIMDQLGFRYYDDTGHWRSPSDGTLLQKDVLFIRSDRYIPEMGRV